jgi:co-chaperonin GroES (HSP10)
MRLTLPEKKDITKTMIKLVPSKEVVILKPMSMKQTKSGLYIPLPENNKERQEFGEVFAIGTGDKPVDFKEGDIVIYRRYSDNDIDIPQLGEKYNFIDFKDIMAVMKGKI